MKKIYLIFLLLLIVFMACKKTADNDDNSTVTEEDLISYNNIISLQNKAAENYFTWLQTMDSLKVIEKLQQFFLSDPSVTSATIGSQGIAVQYANGMCGGILLDFQDGSTGDTNGIEAIQRKPFSTIYEQSVSSIKNAAFLNPHEWERQMFTNKIIGNYNFWLPKVGSGLQNVYKNTDATVDRFTELSGKGIIHIYSHGWAWPTEKNIDEVYVLSGEKSNVETMKKYLKDLKNRNLIIPLNAYSKSNYAIYYYVSPDFIRSHNDFSKDTVLFYGGFCYSFLGSWNQLYQKFAKSTYFGFTWFVDSGKSAYWAISLVDSLCDTAARTPCDPERWMKNSPIPKSYWSEEAHKNIHIKYAGDPHLIFWKRSTLAVTTNPVTNVTQTTATCGGEVTTQGSSPVTVRGVCWSTSWNPTHSGLHTTDGSGAGKFTSFITGLKNNTIYWVRAYATNSQGTVYGYQINFTTTGTGTNPAVTTNSVINITQNSAVCGGEVTSQGSSEVTSRGVCWSLSKNPDISDDHTTDGLGFGKFTSNLKDLTANTPYYVRAYATNNTGTAYGDQVSFTTTESIIGEPCPGTPTVSYEGKTYNTVQIGEQCWLKENLNVGSRVDGSIEQTDNGVKEKYCYDDMLANCEIYGGLYQWDEMMQGSTIPGVQGLCPQGWHIPTDAEWSSLFDFLGGKGWAGGRIKEPGTIHWKSPNLGTTSNNSSFSALPSGVRPNAWSFVDLKSRARIWSSTEYSTTSGVDITLFYASSGVTSSHNGKSAGESVRCLKD